MAYKLETVPTNYNIISLICPKTNYSQLAMSKQLEVIRLNLSCQILKVDARADVLIINVWNLLTDEIVNAF